jgi:hypothetical protein
VLEISAKVKLEQEWKYSETKNKKKDGDVSKTSTTIAIFFTCKSNLLYEYCCLLNGSMRVACKLFT